MMAEKLMLEEENACTLKKNNTNCGEDGGFLYFNSNNKFIKYNFYRNSHLYSNTHDLYLIKSLASLLISKLNTVEDSFHKKRLLYIINNLYYKDKYGTPPIDNSLKLGNKIYSIKDLYFYLVDTINNINF